ncbi:MAG: hypothetical protein KJ718_04190 [Nanoarchaeota archaeon]|nr:hypothetical protein [Nanoarchaeota archaeon]MBU1051728.1 hypothetical protein [Nanoarchaeota archaeon]
MADKKSKLVIKGHNANTLYSGNGTLEQWKDKLGGDPNEQTYYLFAVRRLGGATDGLEIKQKAMLRIPGGSYDSLGESQTIFPLDRESQSLLLELLNAPEPEEPQSERR